ncbi:hypothetical protein P8452_22793 [Trifolium repens]|nr:hypothetical protein P8452_22793 [Trifolium repens]
MGSNQSVGVTSCDDKPLMESDWSEIMKKVPHEATLTTIMNTCYGGKFFKEAAESEGEVISFSPCGANQSVVDRHVDPNLTRMLHCKESSLGKQFLC